MSLNSSCTTDIKEVRAIRSALLIEETLPTPRVIGQRLDAVLNSCHEKNEMAVVMSLKLEMKLPQDGTSSRSIIVQKLIVFDRADAPPNNYVVLQHNAIVKPRKIEAQQ